MLSLGQIASLATFTIFASLALLSSAALSQVDPSHRQKTGAVSAPGVYVEETPAPGKTIPGVSTRVPSLAGQSATISGPSEMPRWRPGTGTNDKDGSHGQRDAGPNAGDVAQGGGTKSSARVQHRGALQSPADAARMGDTQALNPQPIPPGRQQALNPQPIPPGTTPQIDPPHVAISGDAQALNPQPIPPGRRQALNPQPIPPGRQQALNPQPIPPGTTPQIDPPHVARSGDAQALNPQPIPPGRRQALNPQPIPPGRQQALNPQPIPPGTTPQIDPPPSTRQQSLQGHGSSNSSEFRTSNTRSSTEFEKQSRSIGKTGAQGESRSEFTGSRSSHEMMVRGGNDRLR